MWEAECEAFRRHDLFEVDYTYVWINRIRVNVRLGQQEPICLLGLMVGSAPGGGPRSTSE